MQAIITKFLAPTNNRGSRVKATCQAGTITVNWLDDLDIQDNHAAAANALAKKLGWTADKYGHLIGGCMANGGYCFVFLGTMS